MEEMATTARPTAVNTPATSPWLPDEDSAVEDGREGVDEGRMLVDEVLEDVDRAVDEDVDVEVEEVVDEVVKDNENKGVVIEKVDVGVVDVEEDVGVVNVDVEDNGSIVGCWRGPRAGVERGRDMLETWVKEYEYYLSLLIR
jgi:hypothetical protein